MKDPEFTSGNRHKNKRAKYAAEYDDLTKTLESAT